MTLIQQWAVAGGEENYTTNTKHKQRNENENIKLKTQSKGQSVTG